MPVARRAVCFLLACCVLCLLLASPARAGDEAARRQAVCARTAVYGCYTNHAFGYVLAYPRQFFTATTESDAGDGMVFASRHAGASLAGWAFSSDVVEQTPSQAFAQVLEELGNTITYKHQGKNFFVVSGRDEGKIFYRKTLFAHGVQASFELRYDPALQPDMAPFVTDMAQAFGIDPAYRWQPPKAGRGQ
jgi:hypothetical protein